jgi:putative transposase
VHKILTFIKRLTDFCLQSLHHRFVAWTKPVTTSLLLGTLIDLARSKSELVAENALLRQQLIVLRRQVKRPACTKTDRMLLVLLARMVRTWGQPSSSFSQRRYCGGIARVFGSSGSTNPEQLLANQR